MTHTSLTSPPRFAIALISVGALAYEILLMRLFAIIQWHHFAYMVISVALLGYGASSTFVALSQSVLRPRFTAVFIGGAGLFGLGAVGCFLAAQQVAFNPLELLWDPAQPTRLLLVYALLFIPFFCAATCICLAFVHFPDQIHRVYASDLLGAGLGAVAIVVMLFEFTPDEALKWVGALGFVAGAVASFELRVRVRWIAPLLLALAALLVFGLPQQWSALRLSEYKDLNQVLRVKQARVLAQVSSPLGLLTVVESSLIPFRHAPGLSLNAMQEPPRSTGYFYRRGWNQCFDTLRKTSRNAGVSRLPHLSASLPSGSRRSPGTRTRCRLRH